jgi:CRISPR system Cascade subunit CasD
MRDHLILKLQGVMQAWGEHSFEGLRPSTNFPTRSAMVGLLAACLGIDRNERQQQQALAASILYAVRQDETDCQVIKMTDYHTVKDAREDYFGMKSHNTIVTQREYLLDALFTVAVWSADNAVYTLDQLQEALCKPHYTPCLGRRCCPITRPLYENRVQAIHANEALKQIEPGDGIIYSEEELPDTTGGNKYRHRVRDVPLPNQPRQFSSRMVFVYGKEHPHVSK